MHHRRDRHKRFRSRLCARRSESVAPAADILGEFCKIRLKGHLSAVYKSRPGLFDVCFSLCFLCIAKRVSLSRLATTY